jgi:hypothetical protein
MRRHNQMKKLFQNPEASKNLWIGDLEQWMDSKYLIESCLSYSKPTLITIL